MPGEHHHTRRGPTAAEFKHQFNLLRKNRLAPIRDLHDRPDAPAFGGVAGNPQVAAEPLDLPPNPIQIGGMAEARMVGHDAEHVQIPRLRLEVDRQFVP